MSHYAHPVSASTHAYFYSPAIKDRSLYTSRRTGPGGSLLEPAHLSEQDGPYRRQASRHSEHGPDPDLSGPDHSGKSDFEAVESVRTSDARGQLYLEPEVSLEGFACYIPTESLIQVVL